MAINNEPDVARQEHLWMVALYEQEERTGELLERLGAMGVETSEATIVRVELSEAVSVASAMRATGPTTSRSSRSVPPVARHAVTAAFIGSSVFLLIGLLLYSTSLVRLGFIEGMFGHALLSALVGAALGAVIGAVIASLQRPPRAAIPPTGRSDMNRDGFLVAIKMPPSLAEQAEEIARHLGAKEILL
jgi:hypothetical protein